MWRPAESQLFCRFRNIALHLAGRPVYESIPAPQNSRGWHPQVRSPDSVRAMHAVNIFPFKAWGFTRDAGLFRFLLAAWVAALVALGLVILWWRWWAGTALHE